MTPLKMMLTGTTHMSRGGICYDSIEEVVRIVVIVAIAATIGFIVGPMLGVGASTAAWYVGSTVATAMLTQSLMPDLPTMGTDSSSRLASTREAAAPHDYVYGKVRKGGVITFIESTGTANKFLHMAICLAGHEVDSIPTIYIDDQAVTLDGSGYVTSNGWNSKIRIIKHLGSPTQVADPALVSATSVDSSFSGQGIAYLYLRLEYDEDVFTNGIPQISAVVKGKKVYDPATGLTAWSDNPALCIRDYLTSGYGLNDDNIDETSFAVAKNICDEDVDLSIGGVQKRYTINGVINANNSIGNSIEKMMTSCTGTLFWAQGSWQLKAGSYTAPIKDFTLDDLRSGISIQTRANVRDNFNVITGTFIDVAQDYITAEYPQIKSTTFITQDGGEENPLDLGLPFTDNSAMAQRIAKQTLFRGREQTVFNAEFGMNAFGIQAGDVVTMTNSRYGWDQKEFEVASWRFVVSQEGGDLRIALTLAETSATVYNWDAEEQDIISNDSTLPNFRDVGTVGISLDSELRVVNQAVVGILQVDLTSDNVFARQFEVQFKKSASADWISLGTSSNVRFEAVSVEDGYYDVRARAISTLGVRGAWTTVPSYYITIFAEPPSAVTNFAGNVVGNSLHLTWTPAPELDLSHYKIRFSTATSGATYSDAFDVVTKIARPANSTVVPARTGTYFIKPFDKLGNGSLTTTSFAVFTDSRDFDNLNFIETVTEHPTFSGAKDTVAIVELEGTPLLVLDTATQFDDVEGLFDDAEGDFDGGTGTVASAGIYYFTDYVDLGAKYVSRVHTDIAVRRLDYVNTFDAAEGLFDARTGNFDGDADIFDDISVRTQVSTTDDDPAGTPTWSGWSDFFVGDVTGRAIRFRAILTTTDPAATPAISALSATVDMPDRIESQSDVTFVGTTNVTFPSSFKNVPSIGLSLSNMADGQRYDVTSKSNTGFTITVYDTGGGVATNSVTLDYVAKGYGKGI